MSKEQEDLEDFIELENDKLIKLQQGLRANQRVKLMPKIRNIRFLLNLLRSEYSGLSKKQKKDIEKDIEKGTEALQKMSKAEKIREAMNVAITSKIKANRDTVPEEVRQKAILSKASSEFEKDQSKERVNDFLEENGSDYRVSDKVNSTTEGLVLENMNDPSDVKIAFRGSKMNNSGDWASNAKLGLGLEQVNLPFEQSNRVAEAKALVNEVKQTYGQNPNELIGHSRGGSLSHIIGDAEGINTTTFNPFLGRNMTTMGETTAKHTVWRTTDDIASIGLGFKYNQNNFDVNTVNPIKKFTNKPLGTHKLENFTTNRNRTTEDDNNLLNNLIDKTVKKSATRYAESENVADALAFKEKVKFVEKPKDLFNTQAKVKANADKNDQVGHSINDETLYQNQPKPKIISKPLERSGAGLFPPMDDIEAEKIKARAQFEAPQQSTSRFSYSEDIGEPTEAKVDAMIQETTANEDLINQFKSDLGLSSDEKTKSDIKQKLNVKQKFKANLEDYLRQQQEERDIDSRGIQKMKEQSRLNKLRFEAEQKPLEPTKEDILQKQLDSINKQLKDTTKQMQKLQLKKQKGQTIDENELAELNDSIDDFRIARKDLQTQMTSEIEEPTLTDYSKRFFPEGITDGKLNSNVKGNAKLHNTWKSIGGKITEEEQQHLDNNLAPENEVHNFVELNDSDINDLQTADTVKRQQIIDDAHQDVLDDIKTVDEKLSIPSESGTGENTLIGSFKSGISPISLGLGLGSGILADHALNAILPKNTNQDLKTSLSGALSGGIGETASLALGGSLGSLGFATLAPAIIAGGAGAEVGKLTAEGLKKAGADDFEISTGSGITSGATAGLLGAIGSGALLGSEASVPLSFETAGLASVAGAGLGGVIGGGSYLGSEEYKSLDQAFKSGGASDLGASVGAGASTGATAGALIGTIFEPGAGTLIGSGIGAGIGSLTSLASYGIHKLF